MAFDRYNSIENLYKQDCIYDCGPVVITEKLHGTNIGLQMCDGALTLHGRNRDFVTFNSDEEWREGKTVENDGYGFTAWLRSRFTNLYNQCLYLQNNWGLFHLYGEFFGGGIQKGVDYGTERQFRTFDVARVNKQGERTEWATWRDARCIGLFLGLLPVPTLYTGEPNLDVFKSFYENNSAVAKELGVETFPNICEGIVIKPLQEALDKFGNRVIVKMKNEKFAEAASQAKTKEAKDPEERRAAKEFAETYVTPARVDHAIQALFEDCGIEATSMKETGYVIKQVQADLLKEVGDELDAAGKGDALKFAASEAARLYKERILG
jgi:Rnl2 family RNA ligase